MSGGFGRSLGGQDFVLDEAMASSDHRYLWPYGWPRRAWPLCPKLLLPLISEDLPMSRCGSRRLDCPKWSCPRCMHCLEEVPRGRCPKT
jgi:hypothetical protein